MDLLILPANRFLKDGCIFEFPLMTFLTDIGTP